MADTGELLGDEGVKFRLRQFRGFRCLLFLAIVLFVVCVVLATLFTIEKLKSAPEPESKSQASQANICDTVDCVVQAANILGQLNRSTDPCDDFYEFACGGWVAKHPLVNKEGSTSCFDELAGKNVLALKSALENPSGDYFKSSALTKTVRFYDTCLDTVAVEKRGPEPLTKLVQEFGGWSINGSVPQNLTVVERVGAAVRELGVTSLIGVQVAIDWLDARKHVVQITSSSTGMDADHYLLNTTEHLKIRLAYQKYMKTVGKLLGGGNTSDSKMMAIYNFEKQLAMLVQDDNLGLTVRETLEYIKSAGIDPADLNITIEEFCKKTNFKVDFILSLLDEVFKGYKNFTKNDKIFAPHFTYFSRLAAFISTKLPKNRTVFADYVAWRIIDKFVSTMPQRFVAAKLEYMKAVTGSAPAMRWTQCIGGMMPLFPMPLGYMFVGRTFDEESKEVVTDMTTRVRRAFIGNLKKANWMDQKTKNEAKGKAQAMKEQAGYPSWFNDTSRLDREWSKLFITDKLFDNYRSASKVQMQQMLLQINQPVDVTKWGMSPAAVNAYYSSLQNGIVILAGILQPPFYDPRRLKYLNYGAIGTVIGHELSHGFDSQGRMFDKYGNYHDWWSKESSKNFMERAECLEEQYSNYTVYGKHINGNQTINENIADNGGIKLSYSAYQSWVKDNKPEGRLPGFGLTTEQLFFVGFAQVWCSNYGKTAAYHQLETDTHSFAKYRVIGSLSNFDAFSAAYKCPKGSGMNPTKKCAVW